MSKQFSVVGFLKNAFSYSIATYINFVIYGLSVLLTTHLVLPEVFGPVDIFISTATLIMNTTVLGLDQAFIRFFNETPLGIGKERLFSVCAFISASTLVLVAVLSTVFFSEEIILLFFDGPMPDYVLPLLFCNSLFLMLARYYNIAYRMEGNLKLYTIESIGMQFFSRLFYVAGTFVAPTFDTVIVFFTGGLAIFALVFILLRRDRLFPDKESLSKDSLGVLLPYGLALAPAPVMIWLTSLFSKVYVGRAFGSAEQGVFSMVLLLSNVIAVIQAGFATFWSAFIYKNYREHQKEISKVHDYVVLLTALFFMLLVMFEDILFFVLGEAYQDGMQLFPILSLVPLFLIISETTVYGISIARRPLFDTFGIGISLVATVAFCFWLTPLFGLVGTSLGLALAGLLMFVFRTLIAQRFYRTVIHPLKTIVALTMVVALAIFCTIFTNSFYIKFTISLICGIIWCCIYKSEIREASGFFRNIRSMSDNDSADNDRSKDE